MNNNRDFIDFLLELSRKKILLFILLLITLSTSIYFNESLNKTYKYNTLIVGYTEEVFTDFTLYEKNLNINSPVEFENISLLDQTSREMINSQNICKIIQSSIYDKDFFLDLADLYIDEFQKYPDGREELRNELLNSIELKRAPSDNECTQIIFSGRLDTMKFFRKKFTKSLNKYIELKFNSFFSSLEKDKVRFYKEMIESNKRKFDLIEGYDKSNSYFETRLKFVKNADRPSTDRAFFLEKSSKILNKINPYFVYVFALFMSILVFIVIVVFIDLRKQISLRKHTDSL